MRIRARSGLLPVLLAASVAGPAAAAAAAAAEPLVSVHNVDVARAWASHRRGTVAFAVRNERGRLLGLHRTERFPSASVVKAILLVARLSAVDHLSASDRGLLAPMIRVSDNGAADRTYARRLLSTVVRSQSWGVPRALRPRGFTCSSRAAGAAASCTSPRSSSAAGGASRSR